MIVKYMENLLCLTALKMEMEVIALKIYQNVDFCLSLQPTVLEHSIQELHPQNQCTQLIHLHLGELQVTSIIMNSLISIQKQLWVPSKIFSAYLRVDLISFSPTCLRIQNSTTYHRMQWHTLCLLNQNGLTLKIVEHSHAQDLSTFFSLSLTPSIAEDPFCNTVKISKLFQTTQDYLLI